MVYNGTSCGLNSVLFVPNFWLPTARTAVRTLGPNSFSVDMDLGDCFLNFPLPIMLQILSGSDVTQFKDGLLKSSKSCKKKKLWMIWKRKWMGLKSSPLTAVFLYS